MLRLEAFDYASTSPKHGDYIKVYKAHQRAKFQDALLFLFFFLISSGCFTDVWEIEKCYIEFLLLEVILWSDSRDIYFITLLLYW